MGFGTKLFHHRVTETQRKLSVEKARPRLRLFLFPNRYLSSENFIFGGENVLEREIQSITQQGRLEDGASEYQTNAWSTRSSGFSN